MIRKHAAQNDMNWDFRFIFAANPSKLADVDVMAFIFQVFLWPWFQSTVEISDVTLYSKMTFGLRISMVFVMIFFGMQVLVVLLSMEEILHQLR